MLVLVATTAGTGHFGPLLPFARACAAAGHEVRVAAPGSFAGEVASSGFPHEPFADVDPAVMGATFGRVSSLSYDEANRLVIGEVFGRLDAQAALPGLVSTIERERPDVVLRETCELGSLAAAAAAGVPQVSVAIGVNAMLETVVPWWTEPLAELDELAGLPAGTCAVKLRTGPALTTVPPSLDGPAGRSDVVTGALHRFRDDSLAAGAPPGDPALPEPWGDPSLPLVYVSFGSVTAGREDLRGLYRAVLDALANQPYRVLLTTGRGMESRDLAPVPSNARVEPWWPQAALMPHVAAMVGHGGFGTTMTALAFGVPQVVMPLFSLDQRLNAEHVAAAGAGVTLSGGGDAVDALPDALTAVTSTPDRRDAALRVADEMASLPAASHAAALIERLARG